MEIFSHCVSGTVTLLVGLLLLQMSERIVPDTISAAKAARLFGVGLVIAGGFSATVPLVSSAIALVIK